MSEEIKNKLEICNVEKKFKKNEVLKKLSCTLESGVYAILAPNGVGKTTSVGKLASQFKADGKKVILAAADTFRAAAIEQLTEWSNRAGVELIAGQEGGDPAAVVFDAVNAAKARNADVLI